MCRLYSSVTTIAHIRASTKTENLVYCLKHLRGLPLARTLHQLQILSVPNPFWLA